VSHSSAASRLPALAVVAAAHALVVFGLLLLARVHPAAVSPQESPAFAWLLPPAGPTSSHPSRASPPAQRVRPRGPAIAPAQPLLPEAPAAAQPEQPNGAIDWTAEASGAAERWVQQDEEARRQARRFSAPPPVAAFLPTPRHPAFGWNYAATHRVEAVPGGGTIIHLNDGCSLVIFVVFPMIGCSLGKPPARGDLFEHMHAPAGSGQ
jgi:hypothetical protein